MWWTSSWCSNSTHPGEDGGCSQIAQNSKVRVSRKMDTSSTTKIAELVANIEDPVVLLGRNLYGRLLAAFLRLIVHRKHGNLYKSGRVARKTFWWLLECGRESEFVRPIKRFHDHHSEIERDRDRDRDRGICQILGEDSQNSLIRKRSFQEDTCDPGGDWQKVKRLPD